MKAELIEIGDEVTITIPQENREQGFNPVPDGTWGLVVGFGEIAYGRIHNFGHKPGIYRIREGVKLLLDDGTEFYTNHSYLEPVDRDEYNRRLEQWQQKSPDRRFEKEFLRELPETPFWEGDTVRVRARLGLTVITIEMPDHNSNQFVVIDIKYTDLNRLTDAGTAWPAYDISDKLGAGWHTSAREEDMELVERGNVWKFYHNEPLEFADLKEEAAFFSMLGLTEEVRNPANNLYLWTKDEVMEAIRQGTVHGLSVSQGLFGAPPHINAVRFHNEELGRRVAQETLQGFGLVAS